MEKIDKELLQEFLVEVGENLQELEPNLLLLEKDSDNATLLNDCFRNLHSIKGASGYMGFQNMSKLAHSLENLFDQVRQGTLSLHEEAVDLAFDGVDLIKKLSKEIEKEGREKSSIDSITEKVEKILKSHSEKEATAEDALELLSEKSDDDSELLEIYADEMKALFAHLMDIINSKKGSIAEVQEILKDMKRVTHYIGHDHMMPYIEEALKLVNDAPSSSEINSVAPKLIELLGNPLQECLNISLHDLQRDKPSEGEGIFLEEDEELYQIFLDYALEVTQPLACIPKAFSSDWATECQTALEKLRTSARYMDYGDVVTILDEWSERLAELLSVQDIDSTFDPSRFQELWARIKELLPGIEQLEHSKEDSYQVNLTDGKADSETDPEKITSGLEEAFDKMFEGPLQDQPGGGDQKADTLMHLDAKAATKALTPQPPVGKKAASSINAPTVRMDLNKVEELLANVGELVVLRSGLTQVFEELKTLYKWFQEQKVIKHNELKPYKNIMVRMGEQVSGLSRVVDKLQEGVMSMRMLPMRHLFERYPRMVRDLAKRLGKDVELNILGEETRLDKRLIEEIADPLMHIIRNAMDHGIEPPEVRKKMGKPSTGTIDLMAFQEGNFVVVSVKDDGRGLDKDKLISKAVLQGLIDKDYAKTLPDERVWELIFLPGVSTADGVSETSGRGVGMDVVRHNIEKIGGTIQVQSTPGKGTQIQLRIPLTLAIIKALLVQVGTQKLAIPLNSVKEAIRIHNKDISSVEGFDIISLRQNTLPLIRLSKVFRGSGANAQQDKIFVVVVKHGDFEAGLAVDRLVGQQEVVIKPLADYLTDQPGFAGASVLGDGSIALIIDLAAVLQRAKAFVARQRDFLEKMAIQEGLDNITLH